MFNDKILLALLNFRALLPNCTPVCGSLSLLQIKRRDFAWDNFHWAKEIRKDHVVELLVRSSKRGIRQPFLKFRLVDGVSPISGVECTRSIVRLVRVVDRFVAQVLLPGSWPPPPPDLRKNYTEEHGAWGYEL
jgi:hypothetical protein